MRNAASPWFTPIPASPVLDANSTAKSDTIRVVGNRYCGLKWVTLSFAGSGDPEYNVVYDKDPEAQSGVGAFQWAWQNFRLRAEEVEPVRLPAAFHQQPGSYATGTGWDGWASVLDAGTGRTWAGWRMVKDAGGWQATTSHSVTYPGMWAGVVHGGSRGDGCPVFAGSITVKEIEAAVADTTDSYVIPHALAVAGPSNHIDSNFRYPASKTDGTVTPGTATISEGSRFQIDPATALPLDATTARGRVMRSITRALKTYGMYIVDRTGTDGPWMMNFERYNPTNVGDMVEETGTASTITSATAIAGAYYRAGLDFDFYPLNTNIPWSGLRLLAHWTGGGASSFSDTFTGANGAAWPSPWSGTGGTLQNNSGELVGAAAYGSATYTRLGLANAEMLIRVRPQETTEHYAQTRFRYDNATNSGYSVQMDGFGTRLRRHDSGTTVNLGTLGGAALTSTGWYRMRVRWEPAGVIRVRSWLETDTEPTTWNVADLTDTTYTAAGSLSLRTTGGELTGSTMRWDDLNVMAL